MISHCNKAKKHKMNIAMPDKCNADNDNQNIDRMVHVAISWVGENLHSSSIFYNLSNSTKVEREVTMISLGMGRRSHWVSPAMVLIIS
jgi:hypothetical protein